MSLGCVRFAWLMEKVSWTGVTKAVCFPLSEVSGSLKEGIRAAASNCATCLATSEAKCESKVEGGMFGGGIVGMRSWKREGVDV